MHDKKNVISVSVTDVHLSNYLTSIIYLNILGNSFINERIPNFWKIPLQEFPGKAPKRESPLTSMMSVFARRSDGCTTWPVNLMLPCTVTASSGLSVLTPTLPPWYTDSGVMPFCQSTSTSLSNWPGFDAWKKTHRGIITQLLTKGLTCIYDT